MKKLFFLSAFALIFFSSQAQPWMPVIQNGTVNLQAIIDTYKGNSLNNKEDADEEKEFAKEGVNGETKNYQFDRWVWYWNNHTDENGNIVSPQKTYDEWKAFQRGISQKSSLNKITGTQSKWSFEGPNQSPGGYHGVGRINTVAFHPINVNTLWIGSAGGGVWKTTDEGITWINMNNNLPALGISDIKFNPLNPNTVYLCSGDGDGSDTYSIGVFKTTDGGTTWDSTGLFWNASQLVNCNSIVINPLDTNTLFVATSLGVYRSLDAGTTWTKVLAGSLKQLTYNPADTNIIYVTGMGATSSSANIWMSYDGGTTWQAKTNIIGSGRVALAVTPQNPAIVKAIFSASSVYSLIGIYSSSDSGNTFVKIYGDSGCSQNILANSPKLTSTSCDGQGWYDLCIAIDPLDSNEVLAGGVNTWLSTNGGHTWNVTTQWFSILSGVKVTHADKHFLGFNPISPSTLYEGNDGGIQQTFDVKSQIWTDLTNGLGITQFYRIGVSNSRSAVIGGAQDNGCKQVQNGTSTELTGGDGMECYIDFSNPATYYTESQYGSINISTNSGANFISISNNIASTPPTGSWITPYVIVPSAPNMLLAGYDKIYVSSDQGGSWLPLSPVFIKNTTIDRIALALTNSNYIYVLIKNSIRYSTDFGVTWNTMRLTLGGTISDIIVDPKNENNLWVTYSGYSAKKVAKFSLTDSTWTDQTGQLPNIPVLCIQIDSSNGTVYVGTDLAVFCRDSLNNWVLYNNNLPNVMINDLQINYTSDELWAGTFGRGIWKTPKYDPRNTTGISIIPFANDVINLAPNPNKGMFMVTTSNHSLIDQTVAIKFINSVGEVAWKKEGHFNGNGQMNINALGLPKGVYLFDIVRDNFEARKKIVVY